MSTLFNKKILLQDADIIRYEDKEAHNTAERVGRMFVDIINAIDLSLGGTSSLTLTEVGNYLTNNHYLIKSAADGLYQPKGNYLTQHQSLSNYYTKPEIDTKITALNTAIGTKLDKSVFDDMFEKVQVNGQWVIRAKYGFYSNQFISALGMVQGDLGGGSGTGGSLFGLMRSWPSVDPGPSTQEALGANLGWELRNRIAALETAGFATQNWVLNKNYLTAHQDISHLLNKNEGMYFLKNSQDAYIGARFYNADLARVAAAKYIEFWQSGYGWFNLQAGKFITHGGTSAQFVKGDGSLDGNNYALASALGNYYTKTEVNTKLTDGSVTKIGTATVGASNWPIYLNNGVPYACAWKFGNYNGAAAVNNGTLNENLNADMLDGLHVGEAPGRVARFSGFPGYTSFGYEGTADETYFSYLLKKLATDNSGEIMAVGRAHPNSQGVFIMHGYSGRKNGYPQDGSGLYVSISGRVVPIRVQDGIYTYGNGIFDGNAASASRLQTTGTYTAWGQTYFANGVPQSISGNMSGVGIIKFSAGNEIAFANSRFCFGTTNQSAAQGVNVGSLLVSNAWADYTKVPVNGIYIKGALRIGDITIEEDKANGGLKISGGVYATKYVSALGLATGNLSGGSSGGGTAYDRLDAWADYTTDKAGYVLSAGLGADLNSRVGANATSINSILSRLNSLEGGGTTSVTVTGSGNAITDISKGGTAIIATKGATFLTHTPFDGGLVPAPSATSWGNTTGTEVAEWTDSSGSCAFKFKKDNPSSGKISMLIDGTVYVNEGQDAVATQAWADGRFSLLGHTHSQYLTSHQSLAAYMNFGINTNYVNASFGTTELSKKAADTYIEFWDNSGGSGWFNFHTGYLVAHGKVQGTSIVKEGGTASQFLKADGSVDGNSYALASALSNYYTKTEADSRYVKKAGDTMTGTLNFGDSKFSIRRAGDVLALKAGDGNDKLIITNDTVRRSSMTPTVYLGESSLRWSNVYATTINVTSTGLVSNLNADMLDGLHSTSFGRAFGNSAIDANDYNSLNGLWGGKLYNATNVPYNYYAFLHFGWGQYYGQFNAYNNQLQFRAGSESNGGPAWKTVAFTDSNVASATKLQTARTLWGQSFDGRGNVDGILTVNHGGTAGIYLKSTSGESSYSCIASGGKRWVMGGYTARYFIWGGDAQNEKLSILNNGNVGIGTTAPAYKLDVNGTARVTGQLRCDSLRIGDAIFTYDAAHHGIKLDKGLYSEGYLSALGLSELTNTKFTISAGYESDALTILGGGITRSGYSGDVWNKGYGALNVAIDTSVGDSKQTPLLLAFSAGATNLDVSTSRLFALELLDNGVTLQFQMSGNGVMRLHKTAGLWAWAANITIFSATSIGTATLTASGKITCQSLTQTSDLRLKNVVRPMDLSVEAIAKAPSFIHQWKRDGAFDLGSSAQYWKEISPLFTPRDKDGFLTMQYGKAALLSAIAIARRTVSHEERIRNLESENKKLRAELNGLNARLGE